MTTSPIQNAFLNQAISCEKLGSSFTARICRLASANMPETGPVWEKIKNWKGDVSSAGDSVPLRLAGALHGAVIEGLEDELAAVYPPRCSDPGDADLWSAILSAVDNHPDFILDRLKSAPQTNEVRRAAMLLPGFQEIARQTGKTDFVMSELGASAGLNMFWDKYHYQFGDQNWGDDSAGTRLSPDVSGTLPEFSDLTVTSRAGCDLNPLDLSDEPQRRRLLSYIWPDQAERVARTQAAIKQAADNEVHVDRADAIDWLKDRLGARFDNAVHIVYHTVAWQYFPKDKQIEGEALLKQAGVLATENAPLAWLRLEADSQSHGAALTLTLWPGGETRVLARGDFHGIWLEWPH